MELAHVVVTLDPTAPFAPTFIVPLGIAGYSLPLVTNVIATALIVHKLWWMLRAGEDETLTISSSAGRMVKNAAAIIVESGLLYLVAQLVVVVLFSLGHLAQPIAVFITVQIYVSVARSPVSRPTDTTLYGRASHLRSLSSVLL